MRIRKERLCVMILTVGLLAAGCGAKTAETAVDALSTTAASKAESAAVTDGAETKDAAAGRVASENETVGQIEVVKNGMEPIDGKEMKDGVYSIEVDSSSSMFKITECELTVKDGVMNAIMTMNGTGYLKLYMGTGSAALEASEKEYIPYVETDKGAHTYEVPVEALDMGIDCSAFSKNKEKWYDRVLVFRSDSLPADAFADGRITTVESLALEDGQYTVAVTLEGGSGRASVDSPTVLRVEDGKAYAAIIWNSSNYDYMKVKDEKFDVMNMEGNSVFEIPVTGFDWRMPVIADTIAMSEPHEINYILLFDSATLKKAE